MAGSNKKNEDLNKPGEDQQDPPAGTSSLGPQNLTLNTNKAGMEGIIMMMIVIVIMMIIIVMMMIILIIIMMI